VKFVRYRDDTNRLTVGIENMPALAYKFVAWRLKRKFKLTKVSVLTSTVEEQFQQYEYDGKCVGIDWDIWSGFTVTALSPESESIVKEIGNYLEKKYI